MKSGAAMSNMKMIIVLTAVSLTSGCGAMISEMAGIPIVDPYSGMEVQQHTEVNYDPYEDVVKVVGPMIYAENNILGHTYLLRMWGSRTESGVVSLTSCQLYVHASFDDWAFLDRAYSQGKSYQVVKIDSEVAFCSGASYGGCTVFEDVGVTLSVSECKRRGQDSGFSVKVAGTGGSVVLDVPAAYFQGVMDATKSGTMR